VPVSVRGWPVLYRVPNGPPLSGQSSTQLILSVRWMVTGSPVDLSMAARSSAFSASLWVPSPIAMNEPRNG